MFINKQLLIERLNWKELKDDPDISHNQLAQIGEVIEWIGSNYPRGGEYKLIANHLLAANGVNAVEVLIDTFGFTMDTRSIGDLYSASDYLYTGNLFITGNACINGSIIVGGSIKVLGLLFCSENIISVKGSIQAVKGITAGSCMKAKNIISYNDSIIAAKSIFAQNEVWAQRNIIAGKELRAFSSIHANQNIISNEIMASSLSCGIFRPYCGIENDYFFGQFSDDTNDLPF